MGQIFSSSFNLNSQRKCVHFGGVTDVTIKCYMFYVYIFISSYTVLSYPFFPLQQFCYLHLVSHFVDKQDLVQQLEECVLHVALVRQLSGSCSAHIITNLHLVNAISLESFHVSLLAYYYLQIKILTYNLLLPHFSANSETVNEVLNLGI